MNTELELAFKINPFIAVKSFYTEDKKFIVYSSGSYCGIYNNLKVGELPTASTNSADELELVALEIRTYNSWRILSDVTKPPLYNVPINSEFEKKLLYFMINEAKYNDRTFYPTSAVIIALYKNDRRIIETRIEIKKLIEEGPPFQEFTWVRN